MCKFRSIFTCLLILIISPVAGAKNFYTDGTATLPNTIQILSEKLITYSIQPKNNEFRLIGSVIEFGELEKIGGTLEHCHDDCVFGVTTTEIKMPINITKKYTLDFDANHGEWKKNSVAGKIGKGEIIIPTGVKFVGYPDANTLKLKTLLFEGSSPTGRQLPFTIILK